MRLADCLSRLPLDRLLRLCSRYGVELPEPSADPARIASLVLDEAKLRDQIRGLTQEELTALRIITFGAGGKGVIVEQCHQKLNRMTRKWRRNGAIVIDGLMQRGLVHTDRSHYRQIYFIPTDLRPHIAHIIGRSMVEDVITQNVDRIDVGTDPNLALRTLHFLLSYIKKSGVRLTQNGEIFRRAQKGLADSLGLPEDIDLHHDPAGNLRFMLDFCRSHGLIRQKDAQIEVIPDKIAAWISCCPWQKRVDIYRFWENTMMDQDGDFATILGFLRFVPEDEWVQVDRLLTVLEPVGMGHSWQALPLRLEKFFFSYLCQLGMLLLGHAGDKLATKLTHLGRIILDEGPACTEGWDDSFFVQPNFELLVPRDIDLKLLWEVEQVADLVKHDHMMVYLISQSSVYRALKEHMSGEQIVGFLTQRSKNPVPQNVSFSILNWCSRFGRMHFVNALLLHCDSPELAAEIRAASSLRDYIVGSYTPQDLIIDRQHYDSFVVALEESGFMPLPGIIEPAVPKKLES